jgi:DNA-binding NarL/FixJ family response regulator
VTSAGANGGSALQVPQQLVLVREPNGLHSLAMEVHERRAAIARRRRIADATLTDPDLALLRLVRQGLSSKAIARATGLSASAVDMRFHRLNGKLNCSDRKTAARLAALCGVI